MMSWLKKSRWAYLAFFILVGILLPQVVKEAGRLAREEGHAFPYEFAASLWSDYGTTAMQIGSAIFGLLASLIGVYYAVRNKPKNHAQDERWREEKPPEPTVPGFGYTLRDTSASTPKFTDPEPEPEPEEDLSGFFSDWTECENERTHSTALKSPDQNDEHGFYQYAVCEDYHFGRGECPSTYSLEDLGRPYRSFLSRLDSIKIRSLHKEWKLEIERRTDEKRVRAAVDYEGMKSAKPATDEQFQCAFCKVKWPLPGGYISKYSGRRFCSVKCAEADNDIIRAGRTSATLRDNYMRVGTKTFNEAGVGRIKVDEADPINPDIGIYQG